MVDIPVKSYRVRRARKWPKHTLIPFGLRASKVSAGWGKTDSEAGQLEIMRAMPCQEV